MRRTSRKATAISPQMPEHQSLSNAPGERCVLDPVVRYCKHADTCSKEHHAVVHVSEMPDAYRAAVLNL